MRMDINNYVLSLFDTSASSSSLLSAGVCMCMHAPLCVFASSHHVSILWGAAHKRRLLFNEWGTERWIDKNTEITLEPVLCHIGKIEYIFIKGMTFFFFLKKKKVRYEEKVKKVIQCFYCYFFSWSIGILKLQKYWNKNICQQLIKNEKTIFFGHT